MKKADLVVKLRTVKGYNKNQALSIKRLCKKVENLEAKNNRLTDKYKRLIVRVRQALSEPKGKK